jgi:CDGSH-type Zn-finger protein
MTVDYWHPGHPIWEHYHSDAYREARRKGLEAATNALAQQLAEEAEAGRLLVQQMMSTWTCRCGSTEEYASICEECHATYSADADARIAELEARVKELEALVATMSVPQSSDARNE